MITLHDCSHFQQRSELIQNPSRVYKRLLGSPPLTEPESIPKRGLQWKQPTLITNPGCQKEGSIIEWDARWLTINVIINLIGFNGRYKLELIQDDLELFKNSLKKVLDRTSDKVEFKTMEESIYLQGEITYSETVKWDGFVQFPDGDGNKLYFKFESEFVQIEKLHNSLVKELQ